MRDEIGLNDVIVQATNQRLHLKEPEWTPPANRSGWIKNAALMLIFPSGGLYFKTLHIVFYRLTQACASFCRVWSPPTNWQEAFCSANVRYNAFPYDQFDIFCVWLSIFFVYNFPNKLLSGAERYPDIKQFTGFFFLFHLSLSFPNGLITFKQNNRQSY